MKPAPFEYTRPESLDEALAVLAENAEEARPLAGGQSLVPLLNMRLVRPSLVVDLNRVPGLGEIAADDGLVRVGALARQAATERSPIIREGVPLAAQALPHVGHHVTRNRGTVGGSIAHGDAAAELPLALVIVGGSVILAGPLGRREIPAGDFFVTYWTTALEPGELVVETVWPAAQPGWGFGFEEFAQRRGDYALAMAACALRLEDGRVGEARVGLGSLADRPLVLEVDLVGATADDAARAAADAARRAVEPPDTVHASSGYLRHLAGVVAARAVRTAWADAEARR